MPYDSQFKTRTIKRLHANGGNIIKTSAEMKVPPSTLRRWRNLYEHDEDGLHDPLELLEIQLTDHALTLAAKLLENVEGAPLNQKASALGVVIDRLLKIHEANAAESAENDTVERVDIYYHDPDGSTHRTPIWERNREEEDDDDAQQSA